MQKAMFGAGCFWGVQTTFDRVPGVVETYVGYAGGHLDEPTYRDVCTGRTGHTEVLEVSFDPERVSYEKLLDVFWECHDPTTLNRQGPDVGTQYRSAIYYYTPEQEQTAAASKARQQESGRHAAPVVTEITEAGPFWAAEDYHQKYLEKRGLSHCH